MCSPAAMGSLCVGIRCPAWSLSSPWAVSDTVSAPGSRDPITACATGGLQLFAVAQTIPGERHIELRPVAVVGIAALVRALWKVGHIAGGYQEAGGARACYPAPLCQAVLAVVTIHLAEVAVGHIIHDGVKVPATAGGCGISLSCRGQVAGWMLAERHALLLKRLLQKPQRLRPDTVQLLQVGNRHVR
jgi:hypothetical protein